MLARGDSRTDWARVKGMTEAELEASIAADPDDVHASVDWKKAVKGVPPPKPPPVPSPARAGLSGEKSSGSQRKEFACQFRLGRACPGHPRLETVETKTWIRGSSPRKTTSTRFLGVPHKLTLQGYFPRTALRARGRVGWGRIDAE